MSIGPRARIALLGICLLLAGCRMELLDGLDQQQANEVLAVLLQHQIDAVKEGASKGRYRVSVDKSDFASAAQLLRSHQLPSRPDTPIADLFPADALVNSPSAERDRLISGLEQRLEHSVRGIEGVRTARVHLSYPLGDPDSGTPSHPRAAVVLNYAGPLDDATLGARLRQLLRDSVEGLAYEDIAVLVFHPQQAGAHLADDSR